MKSYTITVSATGYDNASITIQAASKADAMKAGKRDAENKWCERNDVDRVTLGFVSITAQPSRE